MLEIMEIHFQNVSESSCALRISCKSVPLSVLEKKNFKLKGNVSVIPPYILFASMENQVFVSLKSHGLVITNYLLQKGVLQILKTLLRKSSFRPLPKVFDWLKVQFQRYICEKGFIRQIGCRITMYIIQTKSGSANFAKFFKERC